jgi:hypothetical protein
MDEAPLDFAAISAADLIARLKASPDQAEAENARLIAYRQVFGSSLGKWVLADIALGGGVATRRGDASAPEQRAYADGQMDLALKILADAGYGPEAVAVFALTETLEGQDHDRSSSWGSDPEQFDPEP